MYYRFLIGLLITTTLLFCYTGRLYAAGSVELIVFADKDEYTLGEPISLTFKLKNKGKDPVYVNNRMYLSSKEAPADQKDIYLSVISPEGEELAYKTSYETGLPRTDHFILLEPGGEIERERKQGIKHLFDFEKTGKYKITAVYQNVFGKEIGIDAFKEKIKSKPITIKIVEKEKE
ncbi:MAG: hypothetical protein ABH875_02135 [Candidatus Omnitrophota bacterium]